MSLESNIDLRLKLNNILDIEQVNIEPDGTLKSKLILNNCNDDNYNYTNLSINKNLFDEYNNVNRNLTFLFKDDFNGSPFNFFYCDEKDLIINTNRNLNWINLNFSINDKKNFDEEPLRLIDNKDFRIVGTILLGNFNIIGELGTDLHDKETLSLNQLKTGIGVEYKENFIGIKNYNESQKYLFKTKINSSKANVIENLNFKKSLNKELEISNKGNLTIIGEISTYNDNNINLKNNYKIKTEFETNELNNKWKIYGNFNLDTNSIDDNGDKFKFTFGTKKKDEYNKLEYIELQNKIEEYSIKNKITEKVDILIGNKFKCLL